MTHWLNESFVVAVCFIIFIYLSYRPIKKVILNTLDTKIDQIKQQLQDTEQLKIDAKLLLEQIEQEIGAFEEQHQVSINHAKKNADDFIKAKQIEIDELIARKKECALTNIQNESKKCSNQMNREFTKNAISLVKQYLADTNNNSATDKEIMLHLNSKAK